MIPAAVAAAVIAALALLLHLELAVFTRLPGRALRVLMYHRVTVGEADRYCMPVAELRRHLDWLRARRYALVSLRQVLEAVEGGAPLPDRPVLLTFDDGTVDSLELLAPLLSEVKAPAAMFVIPGWAGQVRYEGPILDADGLRAAAATLELGLHGHEHHAMDRLSPEEVEADLRRAAEWLARERVPFLPALAFPYGAYPKKDPARKAAFLSALRRAGVRVAFRIGNRVNPLPLPSPLEIRRTEIQGDEPFWVFKWKVRMGRRKAL